MSKIPQISLKSFGPEFVRINTDTCFMLFTIEDGDADLGHDQRGTNYDIYVRDFRFDTFTGYFFPQLDGTVKDPKKGIKATCAFYFTPYILLPRTDSLHIATGDTTHFEVYIKDLAGHESNHFITPEVIMGY